LNPLNFGFLLFSAEYSILNLNVLPGSPIKVRLLAAEALDNGIVL